MARQSNLLPEFIHPEQRLKLSAVLVLAGLGKTKFYELLNAGKFPQPERDGLRCCRWRAGDVLAHLDQLNAARRAAQAPKEVA